MKKYACIVLMMFSIIMYSQTKKNGTVYLEHPAIEAVEAMQQADIAGDVDKVASYLADDFKAYSGTTQKKDDKGTNKEEYLKWVKNRKDRTAYRTLTRHGEAYPDAIEYKDGKIWVQTWNYLKGVHDKTGVKIEMPLHNLYRFNDDNKIDLEIYYNHPVGQEIREAFNARTNGTIYNEHEYINKIRRMVAALENSDVDKGFSYFTDDAEFYNLDMGFDESHSLEEEKNGFTEMLKSWDIESIDVVGYPDYLEYEKGGAKVVQSWWDFRVKRKSDGKQVRIPVMLTHDFNDDGMITREIGYYTTRKMEEK